jgi:hypothetical protein
MKAIIQREHYSDKQVTGTLKLFDGRKEIFTCKTLELPWRDNESNISCIPVGTYNAVKRVSDKYKYSYHVKSRGEDQVAGRAWILIHPGNYFTDIRGCILIGRALTDINNDDYKDVSSSTSTVKQLLKLAGKKLDLEIKGEQPSYVSVDKISDVPAESIAVGQEAIVAASSLKVRRKPDPHADQISNVLPNGHTVKVEEIKGDWANVEITLTGWVAAKYLRNV